MGPWGINKIVLQPISKERIYIYIYNITRYTIYFNLAPIGLSSYLHNVLLKVPAKGLGTFIYMLSCGRVFVGSVLGIFCGENVKLESLMKVILFVAEGE